MGITRETYFFLSNRDIIDQIWADPDLKLRWYIGDTPERHTIKGLKATASYHSCKMCLAKGEHAGCVWWPAARTMDAPERTGAFMRVTARYNSVTGNRWEIFSILSFL